MENNYTMKIVVCADDAEDYAWYKKYHGQVIEVSKRTLNRISGEYYVLADTNIYDRERSIGRSGLTTLYIPARHTFTLGKNEAIDSKFLMIASSIANLLDYKNSKYGDSALNPIKVFSKLDVSNSLYIRLDDKISRIKNSDVLRKNDVADLMGYLILVCANNNWTDFSEFKD